MPDVTIIVPVGVYHEAVAERAVASCHAQTVPVEVLVVRDHTRQGAGWARNRGLEQVTTPFVSFLDADDWIDPAFTKTMLAAWRPNHYVYCDWWQDSERKIAPTCAWVNRTWHVITTLLRTDDARRVGGFDESLPGGEDTDFYLKLTTSGVCGLHVRRPLFHYGKEGERSKAFVRSADYNRVMRLFTEKYGGKQMACCGGSITPDNTPANTPQPGDVLALANWAGNRVEIGRVSGRRYPRTGNGKQLWVDPRDAAARPDLFKVVSQDDPFDDVGGDVLYGVLGVATFLTGIPFDKPAPAFYHAVTPVETAPDIERIITLGKRALGNG